MVSSSVQTGLAAYKTRIKKNNYICFPLTILDRFDNIHRKRKIKQQFSTEGKNNQQPSQ